jgi:hypothetical protein
LIDPPTTRSFRPGVVVFDPQVEVMKAGDGGGQIQANAGAGNAIVT